MFIDRLRLARVAGLFCALSGALYALAEAEPSSPVVLLSLVAPLVAVILWMQRDSARTRVAAVHDLGFLIWVSWPVTIPWYVWKTRGVSGWRLALGLQAVILSWWLGWVCAAWGSYAVRYAVWYLER